MSSSSGITLEKPPPKTLSRRITRMPTMIDSSPEEILSIDSELVPSSINAAIAPILRVVNIVEKENPRVALLCRFRAFEKAHGMDPHSNGRGVRQFKTYLLHKLEKEDAELTHALPYSDSGDIMQEFYQSFFEKNIKDGECTKKTEDMAKMYQIATVLYDVLKNLLPEGKIEEKTKSYAKVVEENREQYVHYNILPLYDVGLKPIITELPEIKAALSAVRNLNDLPMPILLQESNKRVTDILEWLSSIFGFQNASVANQREHLILLLANAEARRHRCHEVHTQLDSKAVQDLKDSVLKNYISWCKYLHCANNIIFPPGFDRQQLELLYIGLYLLIWGEASNIRFMPECICYIFHRMANEVNKILYNNVPVSGVMYQAEPNSEESFLNGVIIPIYEVLRREAKRNKGGKASYSEWRNYDDLNEYFWSDNCLKLGWPMDKTADFFVRSVGRQPVDQEEGTSRRKPKMNFVEVRTFWHLFSSFDRMWIFFILAFQAMVIVAWSPSGSPSAIFDEDVFKSVSSIFITSAILNLLRATLDIVLSFQAWGCLRFTQIIRYLLKFAVASAWAIVLPIGYSSSVVNPSGLVKFFSTWGRNWRSQSFYTYCVAIYLIPNFIAVIIFFLPTLRKHLERSNWRIIIFLMWWAQPKLLVGRGMHEDMISLLKYTLFWVILLVSKLAFSFYVEILPLVGPSKIIMGLKINGYEWHEFFPNVTHNIGVVVAIWAPIVLVYFMDAQIWYAIYSTILGGIRGAFSHLGEIQTLGMLRSRFESVPLAFSERLVPPGEIGKDKVDETMQPRIIAKFSQVWNEFIQSMRMEDLISHRERDLLLVPYTSSEVSVVQWPPFLLASKIPIALDMVADFKGKEDAALFNKIMNDDYMRSAVTECYETLRNLLRSLFRDSADKLVIEWIHDKVESSIRERIFLKTFMMSGMLTLNDKLERFLKILLADYDDAGAQRSQIINIVQDIMEIIIRDIMSARDVLVDNQPVRRSQKFVQINTNLIQDTAWRERVVRLYLLLTVKESAINVPMNLEARRRINFFTNSLFMNMPSAPKVHDMLSFSVLTPYYKEEVLYTEDEFTKENDDGISILFYLKKIYPDEWSNFLERIKDSNNQFPGMDHVELTRQWVSYRGQTLSRTVRGMMYYRQALELQGFLELAGDHDIFGGYRKIDTEVRVQRELKEHAQALADMKFTYVVSCQIYGTLKTSDDSRDRTTYHNILNLMLMYPSLRVAYIDAREEMVGEMIEKVYYSVLLKGGDDLDEEIYRIKLPGPPVEFGEGKPENQNHSIIFTRGEALQTIDMNQDNSLEEAFKMRNLLEEFRKPCDGRGIKKQHHGRNPTILGLREHIFTGSVSSLAWFMSNQETSFVTIGQRILASPLKVRFHYGHPDIFDRIFHLTRGGVSKASKMINLSEDIFSGFNSTLRGGHVTHHEYIQVGKGRDVGMNQISLFEAKVANGNGEQTLSRDVYRLGRRFDFFRMLSFYFTTVGFYFSSLVTVLTVYVFLYGRLYMVMSGLEKAILQDPRIHHTKAFEDAMATVSIFQLGLLLVLPMFMEIGLEKGFRIALSDFILMQLQLASVFFTFQLGTKAHYYGRTILHGGSKYRATGRGFVVFHARFAENYRLYSRSHFVKGLELMILLIAYEIYGHSYRDSKTVLFVTVSMWFLVVSWLFAPFVFNPSGFEWQKTVDDWSDWKRWMGNRGGIGIQTDKSWESWWDGEQEHLKNTDIRGRLLEIILAFRFFIFQYGIVYHLDIAHHSKSILVYGLSWGVMAIVLLLLKMVSMGRRRFSTDFQLMFRILKVLLFLGFISVMTVLFVVCGLTISDLWAAVLAFMPTGWAFLLIGQACKGFFKKLGFWESIKELGRSYEYIIGLLIFLPIVILSWFPFVSEFQTRLLFNQAFSRGLQISMILAGKKEKD